MEIFCKNEAARQEAIDPRFAVSVAHLNGATLYELRARRNVDAQIVVGAEDRERFAQGLQELQNYGGAIQFENIVADIEGSPLFANSSGTMRKLELSTSRSEALLTLRLTSAIVGTTLIEFHGHASRGTRGMRFTGRTLGELATVSLSSDVGSRHAPLKLDINPNAWIGKPVLKLPYFDRLRELVRLIADEATASISIEVDGEEIFSGGGTLPGGPLIQLHRRFLGQIDILRRLDRFFVLHLVIPPSPKDVFEDIDSLEELLQLVCIAEAEDPQMTFTLVADKSAVFEELMEKIQVRRPVDLRLTHEMHLHLLGLDCGMYTVEVGCLETMVEVVGPAILKYGSPVQLSCRPADSNRWFARIAGKGPIRESSSLTDD
ncbi:hypothetical protein [Cupriavidus pauculus]|uniref:Uncharacterized protein n=1 Tax=Cupriavidus pauculus TaxID=82633 RepID=A0A3G8H0J9_9BURK|nr:hypothetical protein [Cupriavidus pauculus]AZG13785.1 hypothetical protein EHF44_10170 [Cupriavidus pauculus]